MSQQRYMLHLLIAIALISVSSLSAFSQYAQDRNYFYLKGAAALSSYFGDLNSVNSDEPFFSYALQGGFGYQLSKNIAFGANYRVADYPRTDRPGLSDYTRSHTTDIYTAYSFLPNRLISPYALAGIGMTFYGTYDTNPGFNPVFGPVAGIGLDVRLTDQITVFVHGKMDFIIDDEAMDMKRGAAGFDALGFWGAGVRVNLRSSFRPVTRVRIAGPDVVHVGEPVSYQAALEGNPSGPVDVRWFFGDGNRAIGQTALNVYMNTGTFTVTVVTTDRRGDRETRKEIRVIEPPVKASIIRLSTKERLNTINEPVEFIAEVAGTEPVDYRWEFGDGTTSDEKFPVHTYEAEGTYTITLRVDNSTVAGKNGRHERSIIIDVYDPTPVEIEIEEPAPELTELNTIYFRMGSVQLDGESIRSLSGNVELLMEHADYCVQVDVFTDSVGDPALNLRLSEQRARAVERFYIEQGIDPGRIRKTGLGEINEPCPAGDPGPGCREHRRAESIPMRCDAGRGVGGG